MQEVSEILLKCILVSSIFEISLKNKGFFQPKSGVNVLPTVGREIKISRNTWFFTVAMWEGGGLHQ